MSSPCQRAVSWWLGPAAAGGPAARIATLRCTTRPASCWPRARSATASSTRSPPPMAMCGLATSMSGGNFGWGGPGPEPIGRPGIVRFTSDLQVAWRYGGEYGFVMDCYALNVVGGTAWACYHPDFPIVRMGIDRVAGWRNQVRGAQALVVAGPTVALVGGYGSDHDRVVVGTLAGEHFQPQVHARLRLPGGVGLQGVRLLGRGSELHVLAGTAWSKIALEDLIG